jgi:hypothetical protein
MLKIGGRRPMASYRCCFLNEHDAVIRIEELDSFDDHDAHRDVVVFAASLDLSVPTGQSHLGSPRRRGSRGEEILSLGVLCLVGDLLHRSLSLGGDAQKDGQEPD